MFRRAVEAGFNCSTFFVRDPWLDSLGANPNFSAVIQIAEAGYRDAAAAFVAAGGQPFAAHTYSRRLALSEATGSGGLQVAGAGDSCSSHVNATKASRFVLTKESWSHHEPSRSHAAYSFTYIDQVPDGDIRELLVSQLPEFVRAISE